MLYHRMRFERVRILRLVSLVRGENYGGFEGNERVEDVTVGVKEATAAVAMRRFQLIKFDSMGIF